MTLRGELESADGILRLLTLYFPVLPEDMTAACTAAIWFYHCGEEPVQEPGRAGMQRRAYDYEIDAPYLYAAFLSDYGIDLEAAEHLHWWKFRALFSALSPENAISKIMDYRTADLGKLKGETRTLYAKMQKQYALPVPQHQRDLCDEAAQLLMGKR